MQKIKSLVASKLSHLLILGIIFGLWLPVARWYYDHRPVLGVDFYNTVSYVSYLTRNFSLRTNGWKYIWYTGYEMEHDYPTFYFYLIIPWAKIFGPVQGVQLFMLAALFLFLVFAYLSFWEISKSRILAGILSLGAAYSIGVYGALVWGGSLPYFISQTFFAATLYFLIKYIYSEKIRFLSLVALLTAFSIFGHPQVAVTFIFPIAAILLCFWGRKGLSFFDRRKFADFFKFLTMVLLIVYPWTIYEKAGPNLLEQLRFIFRFFLGLAGQAFSGLSRILSLKIFNFNLLASETNPSEANQAGRLAIQQWQRSQIRLFIDWTNPIFFFLLGAVFGIYLISLFLRRQRGKIFSILPVALPVGYLLFYVGIYGLGIEFYHGGWYRVFWAVPLVLGLLIAWFWAQMRLFFKSTMMLFLTLLLLITSGFIFYQYNPSLIAELDKERTALSHPSSAFPYLVNLVVNKEEREELKKRLIPTWLDPFSLNFRLLESDAQVNIWWNSFFDLPLARGYIDPPSGEGWFFWLNSAIFSHGGELSQLVNNWNVPPDVALNNALYLLDWYGIKYLEADHASDVNPQISKALLAPQFLKKEGEVFFAIQEKLINLAVSEKDSQAPIQAVNYPHLLFIGPEGIYQKMIDVLFNQDHPSFIPIWQGEALDAVLNKVDLEDYEAVFLSEYRYQEASGDRAKYLSIWENLANYVNRGGKLFIDPAGKGVDASTRDARSFYTLRLVFDPSKSLGSQYYDIGVEPTLPEPFPLSRTVIKQLQSRQVVGEKHSLAEGVEFDQLISNQGEKTISLPSEGLRPGARIVALYQDTPIVLERDFGQGKVVWSGLGLFSSLPEFRGETVKVLENILTFFAPKEKPRPNFVAKSENCGRQVLVSGKKAQGILIKELGNDWDWEGFMEGNELLLRTFPLRRGKQALVYILLPRTVWQGDFELALTNKGVQKLHYYELQDSLVSPIIQATNAPTIGIVGNISSYETIIRSLAVNNLNSYQVIPLHVGLSLDNLGSADLANLDVLILYGYDYRQHKKSWQVLDQYVQKGGKLLIETGSEVKQTDSEHLPSGFSRDLPDLFPIKRSKKSDLGKDWDLGKFGPPILDGEPWKFSLPSGGKTGLRPGAKVLLESQGQPLVVSWDYGQGKVIWSGMNLFYHLIYYNNLEEGKFLTNLLSSLVEIKEHELPQFTAQRLSAKKAVVESQGVKGVLFKERGHPGWKAQIKSKINLPPAGQELKVYYAGPTFPGFMYVPIPIKSQDTPFKVIFSFKGTFWGYFYSFLTAFSFLAIADYTFTNGKFIVRHWSILELKIKKYVGRWWEKEDEY